MVKQLFLYGISGIINTVVSYAVFVALSNFIDYRIAIPISYFTGVCLSYVISGSIVFRKIGRISNFVVVSLGLMLLNMAITAWLVERIGWLKEIAQIPAIGVVFIVGFFVNKYFVFTRNGEKFANTK